MKVETKGPWKIETYAGGFFKIIKDRNKDELPTQCQAANIALIAAAPEMLEALELVRLGLIDNSSPGKLTINTLLKHVENALTKARGDK